MGLLTQASGSGADKSPAEAVEPERAENCKILLSRSRERIINLNESGLVA